MRRQLHAVALTAIVLWLAGCAGDHLPDAAPKPDAAVSELPPPPPSPPPAAAKMRVPPPPPPAAAKMRVPPPVAEPAAAPGGPAAQAGPSPPKPQAVSKAQSTPTTAEYSVRLSMGVALPQTGPEGIMMGFSVDYELLQGKSSRSEEYTWVIARAQGKPFQQRVRLSQQGTLQTFVNGWRPQEGPFQTHIEDRSSRQLSATIDLDLVGFPP